MQKLKSIVRRHAFSGISTQRNARNAIDVTQQTTLTERTQVTQRPMRQATAPLTRKKVGYVTNRLLRRDVTEVLH